MKKLLSILFLFAFALSMSAQTGKPMTFTGTVANDSLTGAQTKYYTLSSPVTGQWSYYLILSLTPSVVNYGGDSTHAWYEGSIDGSNWSKLNICSPIMEGGAVYYESNASTIASGYRYKMRTTAAAVWTFSPTWFLGAPYIRLVVQHFVAVKVMKKPTIAKIYLKR